MTEPKIIQIISDHGYTLGLDNNGKLYELLRNVKVWRGKEYRYETSWGLVLSGIKNSSHGKWTDSSTEIPF